MNNELFGGIKIFKSEFFNDNRGSFREVYKKKFYKIKILYLTVYQYQKKMS